MTMELSIRRATPDLAQGILDCLRRAFEPYRDGYTIPALAKTVLTHETLQRRLYEMQNRVAADATNRIIGTIADEASHGEGRIRRMAVLPENQGRGVAAVLLNGFSRTGESCARPPRRGALCISKKHSEIYMPALRPNGMESASRASVGCMSH